MRRRGEGDLGFQSPLVAVTQHASVITKPFVGAIISFFFVLSAVVGPVIT